MSERRPSDRWSPAPDGPSDRTSGCHGLVPSVTDASQIKWTNEKHSMYLNYIEETFVNQMYSCEYKLMDSRPPRVQNNIYSMSNPNDLYSSQFSNHKRGGQEKYNSERSRSFRSNTNDPHCSSSNATISGRPPHETTRFEASSSSVQLSSSTMDICHHLPVGNSIEMSDQNFVDESFDGDKKMRRTSRHRRNAANVGLQKHQAFPHGKKL